MPEAEGEMPEAGGGVLEAGGVGVLEAGGVGVGAATAAALRAALALDRSLACLPPRWTNGTVPPAVLLGRAYKPFQSKPDILV